MGGSSKTVQKSDPWKPAQPYILEGLDAAQSMWNSDPNQFVIQPWEGPNVAPLSRTQDTAMRDIADMSDQQVGALGRNQQAFERTQRQISENPYSPLFQRTAREAVNGGMTQPFSDAVTAATGDPYGEEMRARITGNVAEQVMPQVNGAFSQNGMAGSSLHAAAAAKGMSSALAPIELQAANNAANRALQAGGMYQGVQDRQLDRGLQAGGMMQDAREASRAQSLQAAGMAPGIAMSNFAPLQQKEEVGATRSQRGQMKLTGNIQQYLQEQAGPIDAINNYLALTSGLGGQFGTSTATASQNPGLLGMLNGAGSFLGTLGDLGLLSDMRAKENIEHVGKTKGGHKVYTYNYKGDPTTHMGVMAQEVEKKTPEAVATGADGFKRVDYDQVH